jgi:hypothetical protein
MVTGIGWSGEATRFVWNARAQKWRAGRRPKERRSTVTLEIPKNIKFLKTSHRHKHLWSGACKTASTRAFISKATDWQ